MFRKHGCFIIASAFSVYSWRHHPLRYTLLKFCYCWCRMWFSEVIHRTLMHYRPSPPNEVSAYLLPRSPAGFVSKIFSVIVFLQYFPTLICVHSLSSVTCKKLHYMLSYSYLKIKRLVTEDNKFVVARCFGFMCCVTAFLRMHNILYVCVVWNHKSD